MLDYALGLIVSEHRGVKQIAHSGSTAGYRTFLARFPERRLSFALLANTSEFDAAAVARTLADALLELPPMAMRPARIPLAADDVAKHAGLYHDATRDALLKLTARNGRLFDGTIELVPTASGVFANPTGRTVFTFSEGNSDGRPQRLAIGSSSHSAVAPANPKPSDLMAYSGVYYSEELDVTRTIAVRDGKLMVSAWPAAPIACEPTYADGFWLGRAWHATFRREASGAITGCELTNAGGRCRTNPIRAPAGSRAADEHAYLVIARQCMRFAQFAPWRAARIAESAGYLPARPGVRPF